MSSRRPLVVASLVVFVAGVVTFVVAFGGDEGEDITTPDPVPAAELAERFLDRHRDGGRIVRTDQGGDTVSEGQSYGLYAALIADREDVFDEVWSWTERELQRDDGLFAVTWADGVVVDDTPATDADVDIAVALAVAAERWQDPRYRTAAEEVARAVLDLETEEIDGRLVLAAGPWAIADGRVVANPSYLRPGLFGVLDEVVPDDRWSRLGDDGIALTREVTTDEPHLPPNWAEVTPGGIRPIAGADDADEQPLYGFDAARTLVVAAALDEDMRELAARAWPVLDGLRRDGAAPPMVLALDGEPTVDYSHPLGTVAAAAAADAAGEDEDRDTLLGLAAQQSEQEPTYYGDAWAMLGTAMLTADGDTPTAFLG